MEHYILSEAREALARAEKIMNDYRKMKMAATRALWCEQGNHAFSEKSKYRVITIDTGDEDEEPQSHTICGDCTVTIGRAITSPAAPDGT